MIEFDISFDLLAFCNLPPEQNKTLDFLGILFLGVNIFSWFESKFLKGLANDILLSDLRLSISSWTLGLFRKSLISGLVLQICLSKSLFSENYFSQSLQENDYFPSWTDFMCLVKKDFCPKYEA